MEVTLSNFELMDRWYKVCSTDNLFPSKAPSCSVTRTQWYWEYVVIVKDSVCSLIETTITCLTLCSFGCSGSNEIKLRFDRQVKQESNFLCVCESAC